MHKFKSLVSATLVSALLASSAFAAGAEITTGQFVAPQPVKVVKPTELPRHFVSQTVQLAFTVDKNGRPCDIEILSHIERDIARSLIAALEQWRFTPAQQDGSPVRQRVFMPLELTAES